MKTGSFGPGFFTGDEYEDDDEVSTLQPLNNFSAIETVLREGINPSATSLNDIGFMKFHTSAASGRERPV